MFFREILQLDKFEGADFKYDNIVFKFQPQNTQIRHFWSKIYGFLFFREILQIDKFEGADLKYDKTFSKNLAFFVPNLDIFVSSKILQLH